MMTVKRRGRETSIDLVASRYPMSPAAEAYRSLRTSLVYARPGQPCRTIMVASTAPGEGKTTTLSNLGVVLAQSEQTVLLVDADLRKPRLHEVFETDNERGLTKVLVQGMPLPDMVAATAVERLDILSSGPVPPNPAELLASQQMLRCLQEAKELYDYVLLDTPPILPFTDAAMLAAIADGVILVIRSGYNRVDRVLEAKTRLAEVRASVVGVVLNQVRVSRQDYRYYRGYYQNGSG